jgi:hypothetical protein
LFSNQADTDPFNFDNIAKQRNLNDKGKALAKALGDAIRWVGVPPARWAAPSGLAGIGNEDSRWVINRTGPTIRRVIMIRAAFVLLAFGALAALTLRRANWLFVKLALSDRCDQHVKDSGNLSSDGTEWRFLMELREIKKNCGAPVFNLSRRESEIDETSMLDRIAPPESPTAWETERPNFDASQLNTSPWVPWMEGYKDKSLMRWA